MRDNATLKIGKSNTYSQFTRHIGVSLKIVWNIFYSQYKRDSTFEAYKKYLADVDECVDGSHTCDEIATCANTEGSYRCNCPHGYVVNGSRCEGTCILVILIVRRSISRALIG